MNVTQMKVMTVMKVSSKMRNMMNKDSQHFVESKWSEVMMMKMQMIQFLENYFTLLWTVKHPLQRSMKSADVCLIALIGRVIVPLNFSMISPLRQI
jgi:hypothetical protein